MNASELDDCSDDLIFSEVDIVHWIDDENVSLGEAHFDFEFCVIIVRIFRTTETLKSLFTKHNNGEKQQKCSKFICKARERQWKTLMVMIDECDTKWQCHRFI